MRDYPVDLTQKPDVSAFFDKDSNTISYIVTDPDSNACALIDTVLDFDYAAGRTATTLADEIVTEVERRGLVVEWHIETHAHADHLSAAPYLQQKLGGKLMIGAEIKAVQEVFGKIFNEGTEFQRDGSQFDCLLKDGDCYRIGNLKAFAIHTPGHTPADMVHVIGDAAFVGDTLFMPDGGTARADFPGGDAGILYDSIQKVLTLPDEMRLFMCHDYGPNGRDIRWQTSVREERAHNIHVGQGKTRMQFIKMREERDNQLDMPRLIVPSVQVNIRAGHLPSPEENGTAYIKVPLNKL